MAKVLLSIASEELYALRLAQLTAEATALEARRAQHALRRLTLELERRYGLVGVGATLDIHTGLINLKEENYGLRADEGPPAARPS
ncbi:MAG: hypothetical protein HYU86_08115 [Chloroflexi bacterium]|nr:hypothetical protein [Chloroflexota bacterium]